MKKILILLVMFTPVAMAQSIELTCNYDHEGKKEFYNLTIIPPTQKHKGSILLNDNNQDIKNNLGEGKVSNLVINSSEITWEYEYISYPQTYSDTRLNTSTGRVTSSTTISRATGILTRISYSYGGIAALLNQEGVQRFIHSCEKRKSNKF